MYDRAIKQRLFYFNFSRKININEQIESLTAELILNEDNEIDINNINQYSRYGSIVPKTIPGKQLI